VTERANAVLEEQGSISLARAALDDMERRGVDPTPLNYELWLNFLGMPEGPLAKELEWLLVAEEPITPVVAEALAMAHLPRARLRDQVRDASERLNRELAAVAAAISEAQRSSAEYGDTLDTAGRDLAHQSEPLAVKRLVETLSAATRVIQEDNSSLEKRLQESTAEVGRLKDHLEEVRRDAAIDALTKLANRKAFDDELERVCAEAETNKQPVTLAVLDIDHFKTFNDTWGHQTGDQVLRYVSGIIGKAAVAPRFAARYGGEEFAIIFPDERAGEVLNVLEEIRKEVCSRKLRRRSTNEDLGAITLSAGLAQLRPGEDAAGLIERADEALYASKRAGRNRVTAAKPLQDAA
jgi:diguanylate cyclase